MLLWKSTHTNRNTQKPKGLRTRCHIAPATPSLSKHWVNTSAEITSTWRQHYGRAKSDGQIDIPLQITWAKRQKRGQRNGRAKLGKPERLALGQRFLPNKLFYLPFWPSKTNTQSEGRVTRHTMELGTHWETRKISTERRRLFMKTSLKYPKEHLLPYHN